MKLAARIAVTHLLSRKRQSIVSLLGIVLGVAFFLAVSSLMRGSEADFIARLVDNTPHITVSDEYRDPRKQPVDMLFPNGAVDLRHVKALTETRGIRGYQEKLAFLQSLGGARVAPVMSGQAIASYAGKDVGVALQGIVPAMMKQVSTIDDKLVEGTLEDLEADTNGVIIGVGLAKKLGLQKGDNLSIAAPSGVIRVMNIVGLFRTGNNAYDEGQVFTLLKRAQVLMNRPNRINRFILQLADPYQARATADIIERRIGYKSVSWQEASEDIMNVLTVRNTIMYSVVLAILVVASFGIYNVISTVVMEKTRDIAILKSMGFHADDIRSIFLIEGAIVGVIGAILGMLGGLGLMMALSAVRLQTPFSSDPIALPVYWGADQFAIGLAFALLSSIAAAYLPARKAGSVHPVSILRGAA
jgi:lipoprotein-releasing system permease protein